MALLSNIKDAYCIFPVHPEDWTLLGLQWQGQYLMDICSVHAGERLKGTVLWVRARAAYSCIRGNKTANQKNDRDFATKSLSLI